MDIFGFVVLIVTGFTACAEFGSYAFVHPVVKRLPPQYHLQVEQGLLRTFGRVMPILMTMCVVLSVGFALNFALNTNSGGTVGTVDNTWVWLCRWLAATAFVLALVSTIIFNVPVNSATGRWDAQNPPDDWKATRNRWEFFQGLRSWLLLIGFVLVCLAITS